MILRSKHTTAAKDEIIAKGLFENSEVENYLTID